MEILELLVYVRLSECGMIYCFYDTNSLKFLQTSLFYKSNGSHTQNDKKKENKLNVFVSVLLI